MTIKKYLTTPEEILALKDTDTKIYCENVTAWYCQFINGVLCRIYTDKTAMFNVYIDLTGNYYILVEEPVKEATEQDIGYLCYFYEDDTSLFLGVLDEIDGEGLYSRKGGCAKWTHCRRLTSKEIAEITGYKVEE